MGEPISLASGLLTLATFAFQSSIKLYDTIKSFHTHLRRVCDLVEELEALSEVLGPLADIVDNRPDADLSALKLPLLRCGNACHDFEKELLKCSSRSTNTRASFRDWARLRYMGDDIDGFRRLVAGYKLTINVALTDANLRKSTVTAESLKSYQDLIETAKAELWVHLEDIDGKLESILGRNMAGPDDIDTSELKVMQEERLSTEKCLQICSQLSDHINQIQISAEGPDSLSSSDGRDRFSETVTDASLQECKRNLNMTTAKLEKHMRDLTDRLLTKSKHEMTSNESQDLIRLRDEWDTARQCMDICSKADDRLKESISNIENYATGDAVQFMVSTDGRTIYGKNRGLGWRTRQVGGHLSDASVQQLSRDIATINLRHVASEDQSLQQATTSVDDSQKVESTAEFRDRYGRGFKLTPESFSSTSDRV